MAKSKEPPARIQSRDQADEALRELGEMDRIEAAAVARCNQAIEPIRLECEGRLYREVDGVSVKFADRRVALQQDLEAFAVSNRKTLFDEKKSIDLNHGTIGFRLSKPSIEVVEADEEGQASVWNGVKERIVKALIKALCALRLGVGKVSAALINVSVAPNKTAALARLKAQEVTEAQLEKIGLRYVPAEDRFFCEPKAELIGSHESSEAA